jgi:hypothetical protein
MSPHALSRPHTSALTSPLLLPPILSWLLYAIIKRRPPKSRAPPISLFLYASLFGAPNRQTSHRAAKPDHGRLAWDIGSSGAIGWWRQQPAHEERGPSPLKGRAAAAHVDCCVLSLCFVLWLAIEYWFYPFCRVEHSTHANILPFF